MRETRHYRRICPTCGKEFDVTECQKKRQYCSRACSRQGRIMQSTVTKVCPICGQEFTSMIYHHRQYCSSQCGGLAKLANQGNRSLRLCGSCKRWKREAKRENGYLFGECRETHRRMERCDFCTEGKNA